MRKGVSREESAEGDEKSSGAKPGLQANGLVRAGERTADEGKEKFAQSRRIAMGLAIHEPCLVMIDCTHARPEREIGEGDESLKAAVANGATHGSGLPFGIRAHVCPVLPLEDETLAEHEYRAGGGDANPEVAVFGAHLGSAKVRIKAAEVFERLAVDKDGRREAILEN